MTSALRHALRALLFALMLFTARPAEACTCADAFESSQDKLDAAALTDASAVFRGRALGPALPSPLDLLRSILPGRGEQRRRIAFEVAEVWKGTLPSRVVVTTGLGGGDCGTHFDRGVEYVVFTHGDNLYTTTCSRNFLLGTRNLAWLGASRPPADSRRSLLWLVPIAAALGLGAYLWHARARS